MYKLIIINLKKMFLTYGTYIIPLIGTLMFAAIALPQIIYTDSKESMLLKQGIFTYAIIFVVSLSFLAFVVIQLFKKPQSDGSSLIILSKNISRNKYIAANMISTIILVFYFSFFLFFGSWIITLIDVKSSFSDKLKFSFSILIGSIIIMSIFASVIILYSTFSNERLIMTLTILTSILLPLISFVVKPLVDKPFTAGYNYSVSSIEKKDMNKKNEILLDMTQYDLYNQKASYDAYKKSNYGKLVWIDPWYQVSGLYTSLFQKESGADKVWTKSRTTFKTNANDFNVTLNGKEYGVLALSEYENPASNERLKEFTSKYLIGIKKFNSEVSNFTFEQQLVFSYFVLKNVTVSDNILEVTKAVANISSMNDQNIFDNFIHNVSIYELITMQKLIQNNVFTVSNKSNVGTSKFNLISSEGFRSRVFLIQNGSTLNTFKTHNYIQIQWLILTWGFIVIVTTIGTFYIFTKTKFT